ncbi:virulence RhuM family protein [Halosquirtibacter xylanolyticus]|nr:virulence RhuM family protein [Prolixibacteraceae bacterium]
MSLTSWKGKTVRKQDIYIAKNYLNKDEIDELNRLVTIFLETAELRAKKRIDITMNFWHDNVHRILEFNDLKLLIGQGAISSSKMKSIVDKIYVKFDQHRKSLEALQADNEELKEIENEIKANKK